MVDWAKVFANGIITGLVTAVSTLAASGFNTTASIISAVLAGLVSFLLEIQKGSQTLTTGTQTNKGSKLSIF